MGLTKYKIGEFVEPYSQRCGIADLIPEQVSGINIDKEFFEPAKQVGEDTSNYKVVPPNYFACNLMHVGRDYALPLALNRSDKDKYVSPAYTIFKLKDESLVLKDYFFIMLKSSEKDRFFAFHTDSSIRQGLPWEDFCDIDIMLPSIKQQRKYVDVYLSLQKNLEVYQSKVDDLKLVCDGYIDQLKNNTEPERISDYIELCDLRNNDNKLGINSLKGISTDKAFIESKADMLDVSLSNYKVVSPNEFAYVADTSRRGDKVALAFNDSEESYLISSIYTVFKVKDERALDPHFLIMFLTRTEFDRYARFNSWGSARETFDWSEMCNEAIPIPDISVQREIVNIHKCYIERQRIANRLKEQLNNLCPILIKGSLQTNN